MEARIARLESDVEYIKRDMSEVKTDLKELRRDMDSKFMWVLGSMAAGFFVVLAALFGSFHSLMQVLAAK